MKVTNWRRKLAAALLAGGVWVPSMAFAQVIPLGDSSFEDFVVSAAVGYAYADEFRPTSAWIDDLDSPPGYAQDTANSNWLYNAAYAENIDPTFGGPRPSPRTGSQAMHGAFNYSAQETSAVFEAGKTYTFSLWAQADGDAESQTSSQATLYFFNASVPFSEANSVSFKRYDPGSGDFINRPPGSTPAQSQASWRQITLLHTVLPGAPETGNPVGVAFWQADDGAVDDASLRADPSQDVVLFLEVNTTSGAVSIKNLTGETVHIDDYQITSAAGSLNVSGWNSFQDPGGNPPGFPSGNNTGNGWEEADASNDKALAESYLTGSSGVVNGATISLGNAYSIGDPQDLAFQYGALPGTAAALEGDYNGDNVVDAADYVVWRKNNINGQQGYNTWRANFDRTGGPSGLSRQITGFVRYVAGATVVPEPISVVFVGIGFAALAVGRRRNVRAF